MPRKLMMLLRRPRKLGARLSVRNPRNCSEDIEFAAAHDFDSAEALILEVKWT